MPFVINWRCSPAEAICDATPSTKPLHLRRCLGFYLTVGAMTEVNERSLRDLVASLRGEALLLGADGVATA